MKGKSQTVSSSVMVLEPLLTDWKSTLLSRSLAGLGFVVKEAEFFAGHLTTASGLSVDLAARQHACEASLVVAKATLSRSRLLTKLNARWDRDTVCLYIANQLWSKLYALFVRIFVTQALARNVPGEVHLILQCPLLIHPRLFSNPAPEIQVSYDRALSAVGTLFFGVAGRAKSLLWLSIRRLLRRGLNRKSSVLEQSPSAHHTAEGIVDQGVSGLLLLQEDEISLDRSYRTQPHWYFSEQSARLSFDVYILAQAFLPTPDAETQAQLQAHRIAFVKGDHGTLSAVLSEQLHPVRQQLLKDMLGCLMTAVMSLSMVEKIFAMKIARLLWRAQALVELCQRLKIRTFLVSESYLLDAQAMLLVAPALKIQTLAFQYNNPSWILPVLLNTADIMLTYSPLYHQYWLPVDGPQPRTFLDTGYVFDASFDYVRGRAHERRQQLQQRNIQFIIGYLNESVQTNKYGLISREDHCAELRTLFEWVLDHPDVGLLVKSQFMSNAPQRFPEIEKIEAEARKTGRYIELTHGTHRNIFFPAEMAFSADLVIGHAVGATAGLEAALTKTRCVLLNPYGMVAQKELYEQADIVYPSLPKVLEAVHDFRAGDPERAALGDWSPILDSLDPFQDGQAGHRLRQLVERVVMDGESQTNLGCHTSES